MDILIGLFIIVIILQLYIISRKNIKSTTSSNNNDNVVNISSRRKPRQFNSPYLKELGYSERNYKKKYLKELSPYSKKKYFLNESEKLFYDYLKTSISDMNLYICPKVALTSIIYCHDKYDYTYYFNKIKTKFVDFVLCDINTMSPLVLIELIDPLHDFDDVKDIRNFFTSTLNEAGISIISFDIMSYSVDEIKNKINNILVIVPE